MKEFLVPVELCFYVLLHKMMNPFRLYISLKMLCDGKIIINEGVVLQLKESLHYKSSRSVTNNLKVLTAFNWVGYNKKSGYHFIRGFDTVRRIMEFKSVTGVLIKIRSIDDIKPLTIAAAIGWFIMSNKRKQKRGSAPNKVGNGLLVYNGASHDSRFLKSQYFPVANIALAKTLKVSISTAYNYKQLAKSAGYIEIKRDDETTDIDAKHLPFFKKVYPELSHKAWAGKSKIMLREPDLVFCSLMYKFRKKNERNT